MKKNEKEITSLELYIKEIKKLTKDKMARSFVFRGQSNAIWQVTSGAYRRLFESMNHKPIPTDKFIAYHESLINGAKIRSGTHTIIENMCDLQLLSEIQHFGGATLLMDFTYSALTALYFACGNAKDNGKVFCLNISNTNSFFEVGNDYNQKSIKELIAENEARTKDKNTNTYWQWLPPHKNNRIIKQDSIFIFNSEGIIKDNEFDRIFIIKSGSKEQIQEELLKGYFISEESLFPDFFGYTRVNAANKPYDIKDSDLYFNMALEYQKKNELDKAIEYYNKAISIKPSFHEAWYNIGIVYDDKRYYDKAIESYKEAVKIKPDFHEAWNNMGTAYGDKGEFDKAIESFKEAVKIKPDYHEAWYNMGITYGDKGEFDKAIESYKEAVKIKPDFHEAWYNMGNSYDDKGDFDKAIESYKEAVKIKPDNHEAWYNMGNSYNNKGELDKAIESYKEAVKIKPDYYRAWYNMGIAYNSKHEFDKAIEAHKEAVKIKPDYHEAWHNMGIAYEKIGNKEEAHKCFKKVEEIEEAQETL